MTEIPKHPFKPLTDESAKRYEAWREEFTHKPPSTFAFQAVNMLASSRSITDLEEDVSELRRRLTRRDQPDSVKESKCLDLVTKRLIDLMAFYYGSCNAERLFTFFDIGGFNPDRQAVLTSPYESVVVARYLFDRDFEPRLVPRGYLCILDFNRHKLKIRALVDYCISTNEVSRPDGSLATLATSRGQYARRLDIHRDMGGALFETYRPISNRLFDADQISIANRPETVYIINKDSPHNDGLLQNPFEGGFYKHEAVAKLPVPVDWIGDLSRGLHDVFKEESAKNL